jgi:hypothetical protein
MLPMRNDEVAKWLRLYRDYYDRYTREWYALDNALDDYRLRADTGTPLCSQEPILQEPTLLCMTHARSG